MRKTVALLLLAVACSFVVSQEVKAEVTTITEVSYYEPTNSMFAWAEINLDYDTWVYYCVDDWGDVRKNDEQLTMFWGGTCDGMTTYWQGFFSYDPNADYSIQVYPQLILRHHQPIGDGYEDYYNYIQWTYGTPVNAPYYFGFTGPGPSMETTLSSILLGTVFSIFTQGGTSGPPHHLQVIHDRDVVRTDLCGQVQKLIDFLIVDNHQPGRAAGKVYIDEKPQSVTDSCSSTTVTLSSCSNDNVGTYGNFTDGIKTGCPHIGPSNCGFDFFNRWRWCGRETQVSDLAWMYYQATRTVVKVDNESDIQDLSYKFP